MGMKVICKLPNASEEISGVKFTKADGGMMSEEISDELAARFLSIPGYESVAGEPAAEDEAGAGAKRGRKPKTEE